MKKKLLQIVSIIAILALAGCGKTEPSETFSEKATETPAATIAPTEVPTGDENVPAEPTKAPDEGTTESPTPTWKALEAPNVGEYMTFGSYEQDGDTANGPEELEWLVLEVTGDTVLLLSRYALDTQPFHDMWDAAITWEESSLRSWLNEEFYATAFTAAHKRLITETTLDNSAFATATATSAETPDTTDKVFLLSLAEVSKYFGDGIVTEDGYLFNEKGTAQATEYAKEAGAYVHEAGGYEGCIGNSAWVLRSVRYDEDFGFNDTVTVGINGIAGESGNYNWGENEVIRPAIWITLK